MERLATWVAAYAVSLARSRPDTEPDDHDLVELVDLAEGRLDALRAALERVELTTELPSEVQRDAHRTLLRALARCWSSS